MATGHFPNTGRLPNTGNSPLTTKGDIQGYSTTPARVPIGTNGQALVANSAAALGVNWATPTDTTKIPLSTVTAAGDLIVATGSGAVTNLAAGTSGYALTANGAGVAPSYQAIPTSGMTLISKQSSTTTFSTLSWSSIPQTYTHLILEGSATSSANNVTATITSTSLGSSYAGYLFEPAVSPATVYTNGGTTSWLVCKFQASIGNAAGGFRAVFPNYSTTSYNRVIYGNGEGSNGQLANAPLTFAGSCGVTTAISQLSITFSSNMTAGSFTLYGLA